MLVHWAQYQIRIVDSMVGKILVEQLDFATKNLQKFRPCNFWHSRVHRLCYNGTYAVIPLQYPRRPTTVATHHKQNECPPCVHWVHHWLHLNKTRKDALGRLSVITAECTNLIWAKELLLIRQWFKLLMLTPYLIYTYCYTLFEHQNTPTWLLQKAAARSPNNCLFLGL